MQVNEECPYNKSDGYTEANLERNRYGDIIGIRGPGNELYTKVPSIEDLEGTYECLVYSEEYRNDWHYVTISK